MGVRILAIAIACVLLAAPAVGEETVFNRWYAVRLQDRHAGWYREWAERTDTELRTRYKMHITVRRAGTPVTLEVEGRFVETREGEPLRASFVRRVSGSVRRRKVRFGDNTVRIVKEIGDRRSVRTVELAEGEGWLPPAAAGRYVEKQLEAGKKKISYRTYAPGASPRPYRITIEMLGKETVRLYGRRVQATKRRITRSTLPDAETIEYVDEKGKLLRTTTKMGELELALLATDKALAKADVDPPELIAQTLVHPDFEIDRPRRLRRASYRLSLEEGRMPDLPESAVQRVQRVGPQTARVTVALDEPRTLQREKPPEVRHTPMIDGRSARVQRLAKRAVRGVGKDPSARVQAMRRFVHGHMREVDLSVGLASAAEVAKTGAGDCTEHAVLLAAMLKAEGIPARVASGLIYVRRFAGESDVFGYHMWTQAWVDGRWVDVDATLAQASFDATHILLKTSQLEAGHLQNDLMAMAPLIGNLSIEAAERP